METGELHPTSVRKFRDSSSWGARVEWVIMVQLPSGLRGRSSMSVSVNRRQDSTAPLRYALRMSTTSSKRPRSGGAQVPRDADTGTKSTRRKREPQSAADVNPRDEYYTDQDKPLVAGSKEARALHENPPPTKGELGVGTAGDAARPSKPGIHNKPIPPRGQM
jgi:hypothetical protein